MIAMIAPVILSAFMQAQVPDALAVPAIQSQPAGDDSTSLVTSFKDLPHAFVRLGEWTNLAVLGASGAAAAAVHPEDQTLSTDAANSVTVDRLTEGGSIVGSAYVQVGAAVTTWLIGTTRSQPSIAALGVDLVEAQIVNGVITTAMKYTVQRTRPDGGRYSFPSGHTSATFATAAVLDGHYGLKVGIPAYVLGAYVATSRVHDRKHFASDAIMGAGIGIVSGRAARGPRHSRITEMIVPIDRGIAVAGTVACPW
jgi:membrane-associated phospholipid phosphatase